ncbi:Detected protein of unknown function [Hibiscus syriacus]|uniref:Uncharacterized protein n=1 Tax=Hibiscus syriacus TaxID=106335 RepID=A0A6A2Z525_HIBSY|nr:Detected protein of unknown function [Hibiscus syriacus]
MLNLEENPKLDLTSSNDIPTQKISVSHHINGFQHTADNKSDGFVIDMEGFSHGGSNKEINQNSRLTKSLSRKGSQRGGDKKIIITSNCNSSVIKMLLSPPPQEVTWSRVFTRYSTAEKPVTGAVASTNQTSKVQVHHQITISTGNIATATDSRFSLQRNNSRRCSSQWLLYPKRILFLFATLSSIGTILLIYFTLSINKTNGNENAFD